MFRINISNREYTECSMSNTLSSKQEKVNFNPIEFKLLNQDIFEFREDKPYLLHSTVRKMTCIPGILAVENNKVCGIPLYCCWPETSQSPQGPSQRVCVLPLTSCSILGLRLCIWIDLA